MHMDVLFFEIPASKFLMPLAIIKTGVKKKKQESV
jgi:hypothetical protein